MKFISASAVLFRRVISTIFSHIAQKALTLVKFVARQWEKLRKMAFKFFAARLMNDSYGKHKHKHKHIMND